MKRSIFFLITITLFLANTNADAESKKTPVMKVGFILPLSGEWAFLGNGIRDAALLAKEDLEKSEFPIELIFEDNHGDLTASVTASSRLVAQEKVDAFISIISGVGKILKSKAEKEKIINIGICSDTEVADGRYSFINYLTAEQGVAKFVDYFPKAFENNKSVGIYALNEAGFQKIIDELKRQVRDTIEIKFIENFDKGISDFRPVLLRTASAKPDALLILGLSPEIELIAKQAKSLGLSIQLTSIESFGLANDKSVFEGSWFIDSAVPNADFRERFRKVYGREVTPGTGHSYDSVMLLAKAFGSEEANVKVDRATALKRFREISNFDGVIGKLKVRSDGVVWSAASVKKIVNGQAQLLVP